jgi:hypothetical protein
MDYQSAKELLQKNNEVGFQIIENAIRQMSDNEMLAIPVIDPHTKIVAEKYAWCFTIPLKSDYHRYYRMYLISSYVMRDEKITEPNFA